jgi:hypothetical protein
LIVGMTPPPRFSRGADRQQEDVLSASWPPSAAWRSYVQPLMSAWARRAEDQSFDQTDDKDAVPIAQLAAQLRCHLPEPADETWARQRHLGVRRARLAAESVSQVQQLRDLFKCAWPAVLDTALQPFKPATRHAARTVALARAEDGDLGRVPGSAGGAWTQPYDARSRAGTS